MSLRDDISLAGLVRATQRLAEEGDRITYLGICPMSEELIRAPIELALKYDFPVLFVASDLPQLIVPPAKEESREMIGLAVGGR